MKISEIQVDRFGVWEGLSLENLSTDLTVFYGPNEAGKTTLMQFVRSVLYGYTADRRTRYLQSFASGRVGGTLQVTDNRERLAIARHAAGTEDPGTPVVADFAGARLPETRLADLLGAVDETTYINVFACGLREIQELGTLSDTDAATLLYDLTLGADRVSLSAAVREVENEKNRLLSGDIRHSSIAQLLQEREKLRAEIDSLGELTPKYLELCSRRAQLDREIDQHSGTEPIDREIRVVELAKAVADLWRQRGEIDRQIGEFGPNDASAVDLLAELDSLGGKITERTRRRNILAKKRRRLRREIRGIEVNDLLCEQAPKLESLAEQQSWMGSLAGQIKKLQDEVAELELAAESAHTVWIRPNKSAGGSSSSQTGTAALAANSPAGKSGGNVPAGKPVAAPQLTERQMSDLRQAAKSLSEARRRYRALKGDLGLSGGQSDVEQKIRALLGDRADLGLHVAVEEAGETVTLLRRRVQLEEKLEQMARREKDLNFECGLLFEKQQLPGWMLGAFGGCFVLGAALVMLYISSWMLPADFANSLGWPIPYIGLALMGMGALGKSGMERNAALELDQARRQLDALTDQLISARQERDAIDKQVIGGAGPLAVRLREAEKELAELEALLPLQSQREAAAHLSRDYQRRRAQAKRDAQAGRKRWKSALQAMGWPISVSPGEFHDYCRRHKQAKEALSMLRIKREELASRQRDFTGVADRIFQLASDVGLPSVGADALSRLKEMQTLLIEHAGRRERRATLKRQAVEQRRRQVKYERGVTSLTRKREHLLLESGYASEEEARHRALRHAEFQSLDRQRGNLTQQIKLVLGMSATEEMVGKYLDGRNLDTFHHELVESLANVRASLQVKLEQRAELQQQIKQLADDRRPAEKRLELAGLVRRIEGQIERWRALAVTGSLLSRVQSSYERTHQPAALREATEYLSRMTGGKYVRVWTPLGEPELRVDEADGKSLSVEVLSAGTREQLFLALRLALVKLYAERGIRLPLVLDDVLVNFDDSRAQAAAEVLQEFTKQGHQVLVFTCHEHIARIFKRLDVDVRELPVNGRVLGLFVDKPKPAPAPIVPEVKAPEPPPIILPPPVQLQPARADMSLAPISVRFQRIEYDPSYVAPPPTKPRPQVVRLKADRAQRRRLEREAILQTTAVAPPPPKPAPKPAPPRRKPQTATLVDRVAWDAEEFEGELKDQVGRKIIVAADAQAEHSNGNVWYAQHDTLVEEVPETDETTNDGIS